jgi:hypothetical protein
MRERIAVKKVVMQQWNAVKTANAPCPVMRERIAVKTANAPCPVMRERIVVNNNTGIK